jgi:hypothetical protein
MMVALASELGRPERGGRRTAAAGREVDEERLDVFAADCRRCHRHPFGGEEGSELLRAVDVALVSPFK